MTEIAPVFEPGSVIEHNGQRLTVIEDRGDEVEFAVPASARPLRGSGRVLVTTGATTTISKADLVLAALLARERTEREEEE